MFNLQGIQDSAKEFVADNATTLLTAGGVVGVVGTGVLAWRGGYKSGRIVESEFQSRSMQGVDADAPELPKTEKAKLVWLEGVPPILCGSATIAAVIFSHRMSAQKAAALAAAYGISQNRLEEYKAKVEEKFGINKSDKVRTDIQQDRVNENPPPTKDIVIIGSGEVLCYDSWSGRYFKSTVEAVRRAENAVNQEIFNTRDAPLSKFYDELELLPVSMGEELGWNVNHSCKIHLDAVMSPQQEPCMTIEFANYPIQEYREIHGRGSY